MCWYTGSQRASGIAKGISIHCILYKITFRISGVCLILVYLSPSNDRCSIMSRYLFLSEITILYSSSQIPQLDHSHSLSLSRITISLLQYQVQFQQPSQFQSSKLLPSFKAYKVITVQCFCRSVQLFIHKIVFKIDFFSKSFILRSNNT